ncbi:MAG: hypothetical protein AAFY21_22360, partial [Cyanobacteria bacterium J06641_2]
FNSVVSISCRSWLSRNSGIISFKRAFLATELKQNQEQHQRNFEEHQRTSNAALQSLEAILLRLTNNGNS